MPKTERALTRLVSQYSRTRSHSRPLCGEYGYNHILNVNLIEECLKIYNRKKSTVRVLDIGCGDGLALSQLKKDIQRMGLGEHFEFFGLGSNAYRKMHIPKSHFIKSGIFEFQLDSKPFDLIISVYAFQYIWHKLEALEKIYNSLMSAEAKAIIHFPGYLVLFSEHSSDILQNEVNGNSKFTSFIKKWSSEPGHPNIKYSLVPYYSDDDDRSLLTEFGNLRFFKEGADNIQFETFLTGFSLYDEGFILGGLDKNISYVSSIYNFEKEHKPELPKADPTIITRDFTKESSLCRIVTLNHKYKGKDYDFHLGIHPLKSNVIVGIYPAAEEELCGDAVPYQKLAVELQARQLGAVVRCNGLYDTSEEFHTFNDAFVRLFMDYVSRNAKEICGTTRPEIYLIGYSSGASAVATVASKYRAVKKMLLLAPSFDAESSALEESITKYTGELYVVIGDRDEVVLPEQARWFYDQAQKAKARRFEEVVCCGHYFNGYYNKEAVLESAFRVLKNDDSA